MTASKLVLNSASGVGGDTTDVDDVFSTFLYVGNGYYQAIENGIALGNSNDGGSVNFNGKTGSVGDWVVMPSSADFGYGTGDFTIEFFIFLKSTGAVYTVWDQRTSSQDFNTASILIFIEADGTIRFDTLSSAGGNTGRIEGSVSDGQWYHFALCRSGTSTKMFLNGTQAGSTFSDSTDYVTPASSWSIGGSEEQNQYSSDVYISNVRVVKGTALYTSNFTAPTSELTAVTNTKLLTFQGDTPFVDNSSSSHTLTVNSEPLASEFGPFTGSSGEGGLIWTKERNGAQDHTLFDTERGTNRINTNNTSAQFGDPDGVRAFNSNGYIVSNGGDVNNQYDEFVSWTFRKAPKFFDVVTWTGNGNDGRTISHNLGSTPGMIIATRTDSTSYKRVWHRSQTGKYINLHDRDALESDSASNGVFNNYAGNASTFTVGTNLNASSATYVAYIFAHNDGDGNFGPNSNQDIIKCGTYTTDGSENATINLGFEPQWIIVKRIDGSGGAASYDWRIFDSMRGWNADGDYAYLAANVADSESYSTARYPLTSTGFRQEQLGANRSYVYMAVRRGTLNTPEDAAKVFKTVVPTVNKNASNADNPYWTSNFPVDMVIHRFNGGSNESHLLANRVTGGANGVTTNTGKSMKMDTDGTEGNSHSYGNALEFDNTNGIHTSIGYGYVENSSEDFVHMWRRAPGYFDIVHYVGTGSNTTVAHSLGVVPEMMWVKPRNITDHWHVYHSSITADKYLTINNTTASNDSDTVWNDTTPTSSVFTVGTNGGVNGNGNKYIAFLFATIAGISKVGSFSHTNGSTTNVDCGFSNGARLIITKRTDSTSNWLIFNSVRGIVSGNDRHFHLNEDEAERANEDLVDPLGSGFTATSDFATGTYMFYAIA